MSERKPPSTLATYLVTNVTVAAFWILLRVLNRTSIEGREHVGEQPNTLLLSNHQSMIDSFLVGLGAYFPRSLLKPHLIPWNPAAEENFFSSPARAWLARRWRCIPVRAGRRDLNALHAMIRALPTGVMAAFPEGSRSRDGSVGAGRPGAGLLILATRPRVVPVAIEGMAEVLPVGAVVPRLFKRVHVRFGPPVDYSDLLELPRSRETVQALVDRVMNVVREMHDGLRHSGGDA